jgi:hypothetical protein
MRQLRRFDLRQLRTATATSYAVAWSFVSGLSRTGFVAKRNGRFVLVRDSGPKAPRLRVAAKPHDRLIGAEDLNTGIRYGVDGGEAPGPAAWACKRTPPEPKPRRRWHPRWRKRQPRHAGGAA